MNQDKGQDGGVNITGAVGTVGGDIVGRDKIIINIVASPIGKAIIADLPPGPNRNVDVKHKFSIGWPGDPDWIPSSRMGAYQLAELGVIPKREISVLFGLVKKEYFATFGIFKIQRPQASCVGWVIVDICPKFNDNWIAKLMSKCDDLDLMGIAGGTVQQVIKAGGTIISRDVGSNSVAIVYNLNNGDHPVNTLIISGKYYVYSIRSPVYPTLAAYDKLREETHTILNSFKLLSRNGVRHDIRAILFHACSSPAMARLPRYALPGQQRWPHRAGHESGRGKCTSARVTLRSFLLRLQAKVNHIRSLAVKGRVRAALVVQSSDRAPTMGLCHSQLK